MSRFQQPVRLVQSPAYKSPTRGNEIRHIRSVGSSGVANCADDNHPIEKLGIAGVQQLFHRAVDQTSSFALTHHLQELVIEVCVDLSNTWRPGKMREPPSGENCYPLICMVGDLSDHLADFITTARTRCRVDPSIHVIGRIQGSLAHAK